MGSHYFRDYVAMINRIHLVELVDAHAMKSQRPAFRASLIVNPLTGVPYGSSEPAQNLEASA
jgi:hypothetical protein